MPGQLIYPFPPSTLRNKKNRILFEIEASGIIQTIISFFKQSDVT